MRHVLAPATACLLLLAGSTALAGGPQLPELSDKQIAEFREVYAKAGKALQADKPARAALSYERAARIHGGNEGLYYNLACAYARQGRSAHALAALERAAAAGWSDAEWPTKDSDLELLHGTPGFERWTERVGASRSGGSWPEVEPASLVSDEEAIEDTADEWTADVRRLRGVIGASETQAAQRWIAAWKAASWDRIASLAGDAEDRAEAKRAALAAIAGTDATRLSAPAASEALRRAESWLDEFGDADGADAVRLAHAEASFAARKRSGDEAVAEEAEELFQQDLLLLAATARPGPALEGALVRLIGYNADDMSRASRLYQRLIESSDDAAAAREKMRGGYATRGVTYKIEGLPEFTMRSTDGRVMSRSELPGRVTLLDFWATWCGPCRAELPNLKAAYEAYHDQGFDIVGISLDKEADKDQQAFLDWCRENGMPWPQVYDGKGWSARLADEFGVRAIPFALLVDDEGRVIAADDELRGESLAEVVAEALAPGAPALGGQ